MIAPSGLISRLVAIAAAIDRRLASLGGESPDDRTSSTAPPTETGGAGA